MNPKEQEQNPSEKAAPQGTLEQILQTLPQGRVTRVLVGLHWTVVVAEVAGQRYGGLASTLSGDQDHHVEPDVPQAGKLTAMPALDLASLATSAKPTLASIGVAAINALLPPPPEPRLELNAEEVIARQGAGKKVVLVGHFPFVPRLRPQVGELAVLEHNPQQGDLPASAAPQVIPQADVVAITSMALINHTLDGLLALCPPHAQVIMLGPSTPLSPLLFDYGVDVLAGSLVTDIAGVLQAAAQGANFRQLHRSGVRLANMIRPGSGIRP